MTLDDLDRLVSRYGNEVLGCGCNGTLLLCICIPFFVWWVLT